jgi:hypothetical protein
MWAIPKSTSDWLVKKIQNGEQNFIIWNSYIHNSCNPHLGTCRTVTQVFVVLRQRMVPPSYAANCWLLFWYPSCTELMVTQSVHDISIQSSPRSLRKCSRKFWYRETTFSTHALVDFLNEFLSHKWVSSMTTFVMQISAPIPEFSAPFSHTTVTHNIITIYMTQSTMNLGRTLSFCVKKIDHSPYLTVGRISDDCVHVSSIITPTLHSENVWG